jgi:transposase
MSKFKYYQSDPEFLLPLRIGDLIPQDDLSWVILEVVDRLDINKIADKYSDSGATGFHPQMLLKLIFYGIATGNRSSRKIARLAIKDLGGMMLSGGKAVSWRTIARFIQNNQDEVHDLFVQVLDICVSLGMVSFGHLSIDGTKINASASKSKTTTVKKLNQKQEQLNLEIAEALEEIKTNDLTETEKYGSGTSDNLPKEIQQKQHRIKKIEQVLTELGNRAKKEGRKLKDDDQYNYTDQESRLMHTSKNGYQQCFNHQIAVDSQERVITAYNTSNDSSDINQLAPTLEESTANTGKNHEKLTADAGYFSGENLELTQGNIDAYICPERNVGKYHKLKFKYDEKLDLYICPQGRELIYHQNKLKGKGKKVRLYWGDCSGCPHKSDCTDSKSGKRTIERDKYDPLRTQMRDKMQTDNAKEIFSHRKELPEPVFGQIKQQQQFRQHNYRGLDKTSNEFGLACLAFNIKRIWHKYKNFQGTRAALEKIQLKYVLY